MVGRLRLDRGHGPALRPAPAAGLSIRPVRPVGPVVRSSGSSSGSGSGSAGLLVGTSTPASAASAASAAVRHAAPVGAPGTRRPGPGGRRAADLPGGPARHSLSRAHCSGQRDLHGVERVEVPRVRPSAARGHGRRPEPSARSGGDRSLTGRVLHPARAVRARRRGRGVRLAVPGGLGGPGPAPAGQALTGMGGGVLVHSRRQLLDALSGHPRLPGSQRSEPGAACSATGCSSSEQRSASSRR